MSKSKWKWEVAPAAAAPAAPTTGDWSRGRPSAMSTDVPSTLQAVGDDARIVFVDRTTGTEMAHARAHGRVSSLAFAPNRYWCAACTDDGVEVLDLETDRCMFRCRQRGLSDIRFSTDGVMLFVRCDGARRQRAFLVVSDVEIQELLERSDAPTPFGATRVNVLQV